MYVNNYIYLRPSGESCQGAGEGGLVQQRIEDHGTEQSDDFAVMMRITSGEEGVWSGDAVRGQVVSVRLDGEAGILAGSSSLSRSARSAGTGRISGSLRQRLQAAILFPRSIRGRERFAGFGF